MWHSELDPSSLPDKSRIVGPRTVDLRGKRQIFQGSQLHNLRAHLGGDVEVEVIVEAEV